nr:HAD family hydrolase [uncultured Holophaga sp.]
MRPAVFLDRDGTLNVEVDYLHRVEDVALIPGAAEAIAHLNARSVPVIIVTNQSGIGRGRFGWAEYEAVMARIRELLSAAGAHYDAAYVAPYHKDGIAPYGHPDHPDRKPNPGMLLRASREHDIDLPGSWMIGDKEIDIEAGHRAGCRTILVRTGYGAGGGPTQADMEARDLPEAIDRILTQV